jgi:hypothetical protein
MGLRRTGHRSVGRVAVRPHPLLALAVLAGCTSSAQITAVVTGGIAGASTGSPAVGFLVGVATDAGANYVIRYVGRVRQGAEQDAIAGVAGGLPVGTEAEWKIEHTIPVGNEHGKLQVVREINSPLADCKELAFSVETGTGEQTKRDWFTTGICKQADQWKWASAEPAIERWGFLQ